MPSAGKRAGIVGAAIALAVSVAGCTALVPSPTEDATSAPAPTTAAAQSLEGACETVNAEWGFALDPWVALEADIQNRDFAQKRTEHLAVISTLQDIADRVETPELRGALDTTIDAHQQYADTIWPGLADVPEGYVAVLDDPANLLVILGKQKTELEQQMSDADVRRYDLCGVMQSGQTAAQACAIVNGDWVDAGLAYNGASSAASTGDVAEAQRRASDGLVQLKAALAQVTDPAAHTEMASMYDAYETFYADGITTLLTEEQTLELSADELDAYAAEADSAFTEWDEALTAGEERLSAYCAGQG
nr:hypothetical protein [Microbacterium hydrocarbonoxydans]